MEQVILVDDQDNETGVMEKMQAHIEGRLHRAFSVFIFNSKNELLLQQRANTKYHSAGLWTNTCCSHPRPGEHTMDAAMRRLGEEMGIQCPLHEAFNFIYKATLDKGLSEHEYDHVFIGTSDAVPVLNKDEAADWKYMSITEVAADMEAHPALYTEWFKICIRDRREALHK